MAHRKVDFREMSDYKCPDCNKPLKKNLVWKKSTYDSKYNRVLTKRVKCYKCHKKQRYQDAK